MAQSNKFKKKQFFHIAGRTRKKHKPTIKTQEKKMNRELNISQAVIMFYNRNVLNRASIINRKRIASSLEKLKRSLTKSIREMMRKKQQQQKKKKELLILHTIY